MQIRSWLDAKCSTIIGGQCQPTRSRKTEGCFVCTFNNSGVARSQFLLPISSRHWSICLTPGDLLCVQIEVWDTFNNSGVAGSHFLLPLKLASLEHLLDSRVSKLIAISSPLDDSESFIQTKTLTIDSNYPTHVLSKNC